jgi:hypothetical protein
MPSFKILLNSLKIKRNNNMKKILSLLGAIGLMMTTTTTTISCDGFPLSVKAKNKPLENANYDNEGNIDLSKKEVQKLFEVHF